MWQGHRVSIVFPAYNEEAGIAAAVADFGALDAVDEVLVVDNNSRDKTAEKAKAAGARVVHESRQGYGNALRRGRSEERRVGKECRTWWSQCDEKKTKRRRWT